jgi:uncharacterized protein (DUF427 family)
MSPRIIPVVPGPGQGSVWAYTPPPRRETTTERISIVHGGEVILDTTDSLRVLETSHPPVYYVRQSAFVSGALEPAAGSSFCEFKGAANYLTVRGGGKEADGAAWSYPEPASGFEALAGRVAVYAGRMDFCEVDGERVQAQPGRFYGGWITSRVVGPFKGEPGTMDW